ncbi:thiamine pyrophosphate-binding protein [Actinoplanes sp. L3-i22]|uniref:thiamine pyrophosphate-binding protein n=1 Tax=Actinoplanes sp. L3-i22 TaxID=2836373 RepID=UPI001C76B6B5|nr:thiamine pyrophosphate-binding protein [Actinoplanes sp. L3-i22]BCY13348.1 hypothetical protein L3i22_084360 [Actinoplanes sp. L3-i22]
MSSTASDQHARDLLAAFAGHGVTHATGVPCSYLKNLFKLLESADPAAHGIRYIPAPREDSALGLASGIVVGGGTPVVLMQNSGLGYSLNVLTSFNAIYDVPLLLVVSWRGCPGADDAVEHDVIGAELPRLLDLFGLPYEVFEGVDPAGCVDRVLKNITATGRTGVLVIREGV